MGRYRKKPVVIEAVQFDPDKPWPAGVEELCWFTDDDGCQHFGPTIKTLEGNHRVSPGDWVITGVKGEKYPVRDDIFRETYEAVDATQE